MPNKVIAEREFNLSFLNTAVDALALVVVMAYIIGALGGSIPLPASIGTIGGIAGMLIVYNVGHNAAIAAVLLHQAIGLLVPLTGGGIAYAILRRRLGPITRADHGPDGGDDESRPTGR
jgi:hypothetical protein